MGKNKTKVLRVECEKHGEWEVILNRPLAHYDTCKQCGCALQEAPCYACCETMLNTRYICKQQPEIFIFQSALVTALCDSTNTIFDLPGNGSIAIKRCKQEAKAWLGAWTKRLAWKEEKICPHCDSGLRYYPTDFGDYTCDHCGSSWTQFGEKAVKHSRGSNKGVAH